MSKSKKASPLESPEQSLDNLDGSFSYACSIEIDKMDFQNIPYPSMERMIIKVVKDTYEKYVYQFNSTVPFVILFNFHAGEQLESNHGTYTAVYSLAKKDEDPKYVQEDLHGRMSSVAIDATSIDRMKNLDLIVFVSLSTHQLHGSVLCIQFMDTLMHSYLAMFQVITDKNKKTSLKNVISDDELHMSPKEDMSKMSTPESTVWTTAVRTLMRDFQVNKMIQSIFN